MPRIRVAVSLPAPPDKVWRDVERLETHTQWMADAESITFTSATDHGVGTTFDCVTKIGPVRLTDRMEVVEWTPGRAIGVQHKGLVSGTGRFTLRSPGDGTTIFTWEEQLRVPWWLGGRLAAPVLRFVWKRNLRRLRARFTSSA